MNWRLTRDALGEPEIDYRTPDDENLALGFSVMRLLAAQPDNDIRQLRPGVYFEGDEDTARAMLAEHDELRRRLADG